MLVRSVKGINP